MPYLAFHTPNVTAQIPAAVIGIEHADRTLPARADIVAALPVTGGKPQTKFDVIWFGGSHGDITAAGKPTMFNGCSNADAIATFLSDLRDIGITADYIVADFCFSTAYLPELYRLLEPHGKMAGWVSICSTQRHADISVKSVADIVAGTEETTEAFFPASTGSGQAIYGKRDRILIRYANQTLTASMQAIDASDNDEIKGTLAGIKRLGHKHTLSTRTKSKWALKILFGTYYLTHDLVANMDGNLYNDRTQFVARVRSFL